MTQVRYRFMPDTVDTCPFCKRDDRVPADWFVYPDGNTNAVAMCRAHALAQLSLYWALGDTVLVNGVQYDPPAPLGTADAGGGQ